MSLIGSFWFGSEVKREDDLNSIIAKRIEIIAYSKIMQKTIKLNKHFELLLLKSSQNDQRSGVQKDQLLMFG